MEKLKGELVTRENLFALVWERPATEVARDLGISDVALGKLCRRLQVPKPSRGYWQRVRAGKKPRQPPLAAYRAEFGKGATHRQAQGRRAKDKELVRLSQLQRIFLQRALDELADTGVDVTNCVLTYQGIRSLNAELAAQILILVQNRYQTWIDERNIAASRQSGALQSLRGLVSKIFPLSKEQVLIFQRKSHQEPLDKGLAIFVRLSPVLQQRICQLCSFVRENRLNYVVSELPVGNHAWSIRHVYIPNLYASVRTELCVSSRDVWLMCEMVFAGDSTKIRFETGRLSIDEIVPVDLLDTEEIRLPPFIPRTMLRPYVKRLKNLHEAEQMCDVLTTTAYELDQTVPAERLALADLLWFGDGENGPFLKARRAWRQLERELECWEKNLESEKAEFCRDVLGIKHGDIVVAESWGQWVRVRIEYLNVYVYDSDVIFELSGTRFRKDGTLGKRRADITLRTESSLT